MYKEEKVIAGVLCFRYSPDGDFQAYNRVELTNMLIAERDDAARWRAELDELDSKTLV